MASPLKYRLKIFIIWIAFSAISYQLSAISCFGQPSGYIRVAIIQDAVSLNLKVSGPYEILDSSSRKVLSAGRNLKTTVVTYKNGILIGGKYFESDNILIKAHRFQVIVVDERRFRGNIQLIKKENSRILVINSINLEDYIKGILYHEVSHYWPQEALMAQAIACRSYALYQMRQNASRDYDVTNDIYSQVYGGSISERYRTNKAVDETEGYVLTYQGNILPGYYHATCGGHTEDVSLLWNTDLAPLKGVICGFCKDSPHFSWHNVLTQKETKDALVKGGYRVGSIQDIIISGRDISARVRNLKVLSGEKEIDISAKDFRNMLGPNAIKSTNFTVKLVDQDIVFQGFGWGHGVGMCQWGAYFMAKQGYAAEDILKYYYPGAKVEINRF